MGINGAHTRKVFFFKWTLNETYIRFRLSIKGKVEGTLTG